MSAATLIDRIKGLDLDKLREEALADIRSGKKTKRQKGVKLLRAVDGMQRSGMKPEELLVTKVPVIPAGFRPYSVTGNTFVPGDANELYSDLIRARNLHQDSVKELGEAGSADSGRYLRQAVRAVYGYDDSPNPKIRARKVTGFLGKILGANPKVSWVQNKLLAKPQDFVGRGVISPDPDLGMDEIGIPSTMAWQQYRPYVERRLISQGIPKSRMLMMIRDRHPQAANALKQEMSERPVMYSRAPAWHKQNAISGWAKIVDGDNIKISPFVTAGVNGDFDGDTMAVHVPSLKEAVEDAKTKLMPSQMLFSVRSRDATLPAPKHEMLLGNFAAQMKPSGKVHTFATQEEALQAYDNGLVGASDQVIFNNGIPQR